MWIERRNNILTENALPALALLGVRQVGKSTFLRHFGSKLRYATLDDPSLCDVAQNDPLLFLRQHPFPLFIDECQLAPALFRPLKAAVDEWRAQGRGTECAVWLSGSNQALIGRGLQDALAGRVTLRFLHPLSLPELRHAGIELSPEVLFLKGGWPELHVNHRISPLSYLNDYIRTAIEKDVSLFEGITQLERFSRLIRLLAGRVGNILNASDVARDAGISPTSASSWIDGLTRLGFLVKCEPFHSNVSKRLIKSPKIYFNDVALATRASGWSEVGPLLVSPQAGALFENVVFQELVRYRDNLGLDWRIHFLRTRDGEEVDFVVEAANGKRVAIEVKLGGGDPRRARLGVETTKVLGDVPLLLVGLTTQTREWHGGVWTSAIVDVGSTTETLLS
jgi:uncharacterized protein